nr:TonB-dependent siderophore receptor [uncultured Rhodoferax sp.]
MPRVSRHGVVEKQFTPHHQGHFLRVLAFAARMACWSIAAGALAQVHAVETPVKKNFVIAPGPLDRVLSRFAAEAGVALSFDHTWLAERQSAGLQGRYTAEEGLRHLLRGSGLAPQAQGPSTYTLTRERVDAPPKASSDAAPALKPVHITTTASLAPQDALTDGTGSYIVNAVTITKTPQTLQEIPQSVSVITRQQLDDQNLVTVDQALRQVTGVTTNLYGDTTAGFMARGYGLETQYDSVPTSNALQMVPQFDLAMYDRIEVMRGPNGLLQGAGNPSGSVNFVRKRPQRAFAMSYSVSAGSNENYHADFDVGGPVNEAGTLRARTVVSRQDKGSANGVQSNHQTMGYAAVEADVSSATTLSLSASWQDKSVQRFMGIPTRLSTGQLLDSTSSSFYGIRGGHSDYPMREVLAEATHRLADSGWTARAALREKVVTSDLLYGYVGSRVTDADLATVYLQRSYYTERNLGADFSVEGPFTWAGRQHSAVFGYSADQYNYEGGGRQTELTNQSVYNTSYDLESALPITTIRARRLHQSGLYGVTRLQLSDAFTLSVGGRVSDYSYETRTLAATPTAWRRWERAEGQFTPYGGVVWRMSDQHSVYASYTDTFAPQDAYDKSGRLPAKVGWQVETGVKSTFFNGDLNTTAAVYRIQEKNRAISDTTNTNCDGTGNTCYTAAGLVQSQGVELEAIGRLAPGWDLSAGYTFNDNKYLQDATASNVGKAFSTTTPRHMVKLWTNYRLGGDWSRYSVGGGLQAQSAISQLLSSGSTLYQSDYAVWSAQVGYRISKKSQLTFTVNNLTDTRYYERLGNTWGYTYLGDPRNAVVTFKSSI